MKRSLEQYYRGQLAANLGYIPRRQPKKRYRARRKMPLRRLTNPELKFFDVDVNVAAGSLVAAGAIHVSANLIPQGVTEITRVGRKCVIKKIGWRWSIVKPSTANLSLGHEVVRMICYQDKQTNGATAAVTGILESANYQSFRNLTNTGRFNILYDRTYDLNQQAGSGDGTTNDGASTVLSGQWYKDCNIPLEFSAGAGAITELSTNNIGFLFISLDGDTTSVSLDSKVRIRYSDK